MELLSCHDTTFMEVSAGELYAPKYMVILMCGGGALLFGKNTILF